MSYDIEHKLVYEYTYDAVIVDGVSVIGRKTVNVYREEDGTHMVCVATEKSDMDEKSVEVVRITSEMLLAMI